MMRGHWTTLVMLATAAVVLASWAACDMDAPGTLATERAWLDAVGEIAADWRADATLASIDTPRCVAALNGIDVRTATEREWVDDLRLCPMTPAGCSRAGGCSGTCVTGTVIQHGGRWLVYVSPGESTDGHVVTVRHEVAHVLSWCTTGALDYGHSTPGVWGADGVVWRTGGY